MRFPREFKPKPTNWKVVLTTAIALAALLFPIGVTAMPAGAAVSTGDVPRGTSEVERNTSDVPRTSLYNTDAASSLQVVVN